MLEPVHSVSFFLGVAFFCMTVRKRSQIPFSLRIFLVILLLVSLVCGLLVGLLYLLFCRHYFLVF